MIEVKIDKESGTNMSLTLKGSTIDIARESSIMLVEISKAISKGSGKSFDEVFSSIVGGAKLLHFFQTKEEEAENE